MAHRTAATAGVAVLSCVVVSRLLFLADHDLWPPVTGSAQRAYHLASGLADRHDVTLLIMHWWNTDLTSFPGADRFTAIHTVPYQSCRAPGDLAAPGLAKLRRFQPVGSPDVVHRHESAALGQMLASLAADAFDGAWITRGYFAEQVLPHDLGPVVVDLPDVETELAMRRRAASPARWRRALGRLEVHQVSSWERALARRVAAVSVCKDADVALFGPAENVHVVPNGVDAAPVAPPGAERSDEVLFVGTLHYGPNVDAARWFHDAVLPLIRRSRPSTRLRLVGSRPAPDVLALDDGDGCLVHADVADLTEHYDRAGVVVVPIRFGGGTRIKALEALAHGKAVVTTALGIDGIDLRPGIDVAVADHPGDFADACIRLLADEHARRQLGDSGRRRVLERHSWAATVDRADELVRSLR